MKGKVIVIEGLDGSGKGTQTPLLCEALKKKGRPVEKLSFPCYESDSSALVKMYLSGKFGDHAGAVNAYAASTFYAVDRYASYTTSWKEPYKNGAWFVADRYATSNIIYQMGKLSSIAERDEFIEWSSDFEYKKLEIPKPDLVIFLDMPIEISQKLMESRYHGDTSKKDLHERDIAFLHSCRESALYAAQKCGWRIVACSEGGEPYSIEEIHKNIFGIISEVLL